MLAFEGGNLVDVAGPLQAFDTANHLRSPGLPGYRLVTVSERGGQVTTSPGLSLLTEPLTVLAGKTIDTLIVPGGLPPEGPVHLAGLIAWLRRNAERPRRLCSVCTGAFLLADAGLLDGRRCTTHWSRSAELEARRPAIRMDADSIFVRDGNIWTSGGVTAGIDLSLALIEEDLGHQVAIATARQLVMFVKRPGGQSQFSRPLALQATRSGTFAALHGWIAANLGSDLRVERLAEQVGMSPRTFARTYVAETGTTPARSVELIRLEAACRALEETGLPFKRIAAMTGLGNEQNLRRVVQRQFGIGPADYRARFARAA
jgi:transcriptional regulator GlxA family with amidase domain